MYNTKILSKTRFKLKAPTQKIISFLFVFIRVSFEFAVS